jgi:hypothetical protein
VSGWTRKLGGALGVYAFLASCCIFSSKSLKSWQVNSTCCTQNYRLEMIKQFHYVTLHEKKLFFDIIDSGWTAAGGKKLSLDPDRERARSFPQIYFRTHVTWRLLLTFCSPSALCVVNEILIWLCRKFILQYWFYGKATSEEDERILCNCHEDSRSMRRAHDAMATASKRGIDG